MTVPFTRESNFFVMEPFSAVPQLGEQVRINVILPSVNHDRITGGPYTVLNYIKEIERKFPSFSFRFIPVMAPFDVGTDKLHDLLTHYQLSSFANLNNSRDEYIQYEVIYDACYKQGRLPIRKNDIFIATMWPTHYLAKSLQEAQLEYFKQSHKVQYIIQDYEPSALYPWSDLHFLAEKTYEDTDETIAIVGTKSLSEYLEMEGFKHQFKYVFEPGANIVSASREAAWEKKEQILIYGRPNAPRNAFNLIVESLLLLTIKHPVVAERFDFISVGDPHPDYMLNNGAVLRSLGFLQKSDYQDLLASSPIGVYFVLSPHTGYITFEMASSGLITISNAFKNKDVASEHPNIRSCTKLTPLEVSDVLVDAVREFWVHPQRAIENARNGDLDVSSEETFNFVNNIINHHYDFN